MRASTFLTAALLSGVACGGLVAMPGNALAATDQRFSDDLCPDATSPGRHLNELNSQTTPPQNDELIGANASLIAAYRSCAASFDAETHQRGADRTIDSIVVGRVYARVSEARALKRSGDYAAQLHDRTGASGGYDRALQVLDEIDGIASSATVATSGGSVPKLVREGRTLRDDVVAARAALATTPAATPSASHP